LPAVADTADPNRDARDRNGPDAPPIILPNPPETPTKPGPWGFWATAGWSTLIALAYFWVQIIAAGIFIAIGGVPGLDRRNVNEATSHGGLIAFVTLATAPVVAGLSVLAAHSRKGIDLKEYFAAHWPGTKVLLRWIGATLLFLVLIGYLLSPLSSETTEAFMQRVLATAEGMVVPLVLALVVAAPIAEETFFRGFLFTGLRHSPLGNAGAVLFSSVAFAAVHTQYDLQGLIYTFALGIFLAAARLRTGSLWICIALHGFVNLVSTVIHLSSGPPPPAIPP
jgi:membrane protease YdiL (CAAX protease family)